MEQETNMSKQEIQGIICWQEDNLGHATAAFTLDKYGHVTEQMKQDSAARMEHYIDGIMADKEA